MTTPSRRSRTGLALLATGALVAAAVSAGSAIAATRTTSDGSSYAGQHPVVATDKGYVKGEARSMVTSFLGIPYAAPPTGENRWKAPKPAKKWSGVRDATVAGDSCVQGTGWDPGYEQPTLTEDCLYINVYRPSGAKGKLPVMVWNHGGGNVGGAGKDTNPNKFVTKGDVVFVTFNYRLGAMGWLDTASLDASNPDGSAGNFGLLDQQAALRWVEKNIRSFGGDPKQVTLAGQSAGASNTCAQLASPGARGLFDHAILQSGGCSARTETAAQTSGESFATAIGCPAGAAQLSCLRAKSPAEVLAAQTQVRQSGPVFGDDVLPQDPGALLKAGKLTRLPVIVGANSDESQQSVFAAYDYKGTPLTAAGFDSLVASTYPAFADQVRAAYPVASYQSPTVAWGAVSSDASACRTQTLRDRLGADTRTYTYEFAEKDGPAFTSIWRLNTDYPFGATHVNELGYLWDYLGTALPFSADQVELSDQMISYWSSFVHTGDPNTAFTPRWPTYRPNGSLLQFVAPSATTVSKSDIADQHRCELWDQVSPAV